MAKDPSSDRVIAAANKAESPRQHECHVVVHILAPGSRLFNSQAKIARLGQWRHVLHVAGARQQTAFALPAVGEEWPQSGWLARSAGEEQSRWRFHAMYKYLFIFAERWSDGIPTVGVTALPFVFVAHEYSLNRSFVAWNNPRRALTDGSSG
jgi:hypothetical protein